MARQALFAGLVADERGDPVEVAYVGGESFYVVDDAGFKRHIESERVDRQVLEALAEFVRGHEDLISAEAMKALGQQDIFTKAAIEASLKNLDKQFAQVLERGLPEEARAWMGMLGFQVRIDMHGNVLEVRQPSGPEEPPE
jgi:hypothetical protein